MYDVRGTLYYRYAEKAAVFFLASEYYFLNKSDSAFEELRLPSRYLYRDTVDDLVIAFFVIA